MGAGPRLYPPEALGTAETSSSPTAAQPGGTPRRAHRLKAECVARVEDCVMGKGCLLWAVGVPLPIILLLYFFKIL